MKKLFLLGLTAILAVNVQAAKALELNVTHINDHHSHLEEETMKLKLNGKDVNVKIGGFPRVVSKIKELSRNPKVKGYKKADNALILHAGDAISGTLYYTLFKGKADAALMNTVDFDAFTLGNHEFDDGNKVLLDFLNGLKVPTISANVIPDKGSILEGKWKPYMVKKIRGEKVGIIGLDVVGKTVESSSPGKDIKFLDEIETAQKMANELKKQGINKIILLSHAGYERNVEIAQKVSGIDLIITGDTHYLLGEKYKEYGLKPVAEYPKKVMSPAGEPVYVAEAFSYSYLVGNMKVKFNKKGVITELIPNPQIIIGDNFFEVKDAEGKNVQLTGKDKEDVIKFVKSRNDISFVKEDATAKNILNKYKQEKEEIAKKPVGTVRDEMPGGSAPRIPSDKYPEGSVATTIVAESIYEKLKNMGTGEIDFVIINSGGVRTTIKPGKFSYDDAYTLLPFTTNTIYVMKMTGAEVKQTLEDALNFVFTGGSTGAFPYGARIRYEATKEGTLGTRIKKLEIYNEKTKAWEEIDNDKVYHVGTHSYLAAGKDGYTTFGKVNAERPGVNTYLGVETAFIEYIKARGEITRPESSNVKLKY